MDIASTPVPRQAPQSVMGYTLVDQSVDELSRVLVEALPTLEVASYVCLNPHSYVTALDDLEFAEALRRANGLICDGIGLALAARVLLGRWLPRITGYQFFTELSQSLSDRGNGSVYFLGGHPDWMEPLVARYRRDFPGVVRIHHCSPAYKSEYDRADIVSMAADIRAVRPEVLWIGLGSPKQEKVTLALSREGGFNIAAPIGQVFDIYSGRFAQAPAIISHAGLEWAFRLARQPRRLGGRTFKSAPRFLGHVLAFMLKQNGYWL